MNSRLEQYLETLDVHLAALPDERRRGLREEARQHVLDLAAAHRELGSDEDEALQAALRQFGDPRRVGKQYRRTLGRPWWAAWWPQEHEWERRFPRSWHILRPSLAFFAVLGGHVAGFLGLNLALIASTEAGPLPELTAVYAALSLVSVPILGGRAAGAKMTAPLRPGTVAGLLLMMLPMVLYGVMFAMWADGGVMAPYVQPALGWLWVPVAGVSAAFSKRRKQDSGRMAAAA